MFHEVPVLMLGLDGSGKTTIMEKLVGTGTSSPSKNFGTLTRHRYEFQIWKMSGRGYFRHLWNKNLSDKKCIIFVVDSGANACFNEACQALQTLFAEQELRDAFLIIFASKQDLTNASNIEQITVELHLRELLPGDRWFILGTNIDSTILDFNLAFDWLRIQLEKQR